MSELSFEQMLEDSVKTIRNGEIVQGTVIDVKDDEIILNIGYKADGIITKSEYSNDASLVLTDAVHVGDSMEAKVLKVNDGEGQVILTYKRLAAEKGNKRLEAAFESQEVLKAPVTQVLDGGLCVNVEEARVFIPASLVSDTYEKDLSKYADKEIEFVITEFNPRRRRIIGNRKQLLLAEKAEKQKELMEKIHVGDTVTGTVKNVTDFGAFIDLGGADGLLHISEMSWGRVENPKKVFNVGDEVKVLIKEINGDKIALSMKFPEENPWLSAAEDFAVGNVVTGKVARITSFGAFIDLGGVDGLVHVTELSHERNVSPKSVVSVGDEVEVKVLAIDEEAGRVSLSLKATTPGPWDGVEQKLAAGDVIEGTVKRLTDFGAFVEVLPGIDGLVHISQISHKRVENPKDVLSVGQDVTVKVLEVNADAERVSLSIKALEERPANAEGENNEKRQSRPRRPKRQEKRDYELPETQSGFSMADLFGDIEL